MVQDLDEETLLCRGAGHPLVHSPVKHQVKLRAVLGEQETGRRTHLGDINHTYPTAVNSRMLDRADLVGVDAVDLAELLHRPLGPLCEGGGATKLLHLCNEELMWPCVGH